jgi:hypothetical protein
MRRHQAVDVITPTETLLGSQDELVKSIPVGVIEDDRPLVDPTNRHLVAAVVRERAARPAGHERTVGVAF